VNPQYPLDEPGHLDETHGQAAQDPPLEEFHRQRELLTPEDLQGQDVDIVGAGALGGAIAICLCKMGFGITSRITVTDFDVCEAHNLTTQWFRPSDVLVERAKVEALSEMVGWVCDRDLSTVNGRFSGNESRRLGPIVILAVDSLRERRRIWNHVKKRRDVDLLVDARMGAEVLEVYVTGPKQDERIAYEDSLDDRGESFDEPCTRRGILYTVMGAAAVVGSLLRAYARSEPFPRHIAMDFRHFFIKVSPAAVTSPGARPR
jgi:hypothetical protein